MISINQMHFYKSFITCGDRYLDGTGFVFMDGSRHGLLVRNHPCETVVIVSSTDDLDMAYAAIEADKNSVFSGEPETYSITFGSFTAELKFSSHD